MKRDIKADIITAGLAIMRDDPRRLTAGAISRALGISRQRVLYNVPEPYNAVACEAVRIGDKDIVPMLITTRHPSADGLTGDERAGYLTGC